MIWLEVFLLGVSLSLDAMTAAISVGVCSGSRLRRFEGFRLAALFGFFQALMPFSGYYLGRGLAHIIKPYDHWIAFFLLAAIGLNMMWDGWQELKAPKEEACQNIGPGLGRVLLLSLATSIDAFAAGISLSVSPNVRILPSVLLIGLTTFCFSLAGVFAGGRLGRRFQTGTAFAGGLILILIGAKILAEHLIQGI